MAATSGTTELPRSVCHHTGAFLLQKRSKSWHLPGRTHGTWESPAFPVLTCPGSGRMQLMYGLVSEKRGEAGRLRAAEMGAFISYASLSSVRRYGAYRKTGGESSFRNPVSQ